MTQEELNALAQLFSRTPMSGAELLWLQALLQREQDRINAQKAKQVTPEQPAS